jgi:protein SCO1
MRFALLLMLLVPLAAPAAEPALRSGAFDPPRAAPDFALRSSQGGELRLGSYRGKVVALGFGYTSCPDVCPTTLADLAQVRKRLGAAAGEFQVIYVTVDPERDSAEQLQKYLTAFDPSFLGVTGTPAQLEDVRKAYGITATRKPYRGTYLVHHSSYVYLIDRAGMLRAMKPFGARIDDIVHDVQLLLSR